MRDSPHSLREANGSILWEIADTARHELCRVLRNISSICEAYLVTGVKCFKNSFMKWGKSNRGALRTLGGGGLCL